MTCTPRPIFESHGDFIDQDFTLGRPSMICAEQYLERFAPELNAIPGFLVARGYLRCYAENALTYSTYRGHVERLLLWSLIIREKPVTELKRLDADSELVPNPKWKPFTQRVLKQSRTLFEEADVFQAADYHSSTLPPPSRFR
ncbi:hypothetical protein LVV83_16645 [Pseudomonas sp. LM20]|uniref:hypothetical protein n=1 Tax=Pseudomonas sp. LM20 TaxID=2899116 RepID=UPI001F19D5F8|nr:hypothetical protein [Pseudomonas sp. LM20]MCE5988661.1 hypothetical protein [Pseudomonas sp. LM20]